VSRVLVVAAHPDDEVLGCGGTVARHSAEGDEVHVLILAEGVKSREGESVEQGKELAGLKAAAHAANAVLGVRSLELLDFPDNRMDSCSVDEVRASVAKHLEKIRPTIVYTHHIGDVNVDHRAAHQAVASLCRPGEGSGVEELYFFETASSTEWAPARTAAPFLPSYFVEITAQLPLKLQALEAYASEMRPFPHPRSLEAIGHLAKWRGASVGVPAAEAFSAGFRLGNFSEQK
jgi:LmbE family N-acetylglucosaminyl deacetylase